MTKTGKSGRPDFVSRFWGTQMKKGGGGVTQHMTKKGEADLTPCWEKSPDFVSRFLYAQRMRRVQGGETGFRHNRRSKQTLEYQRDIAYLFHKQQALLQPHEVRHLRRLSIQTQESVVRNWTNTPVNNEMIGIFSSSNRCQCCSVGRDTYDQLLNVPEGVFTICCSLV